jgi:hypothetical protein
VRGARGLIIEKFMSSSQGKRSDTAGNASFDLLENGDAASLTARFELFLGVAGMKSVTPEPWLSALVAGEAAFTESALALLKNPGPDLAKTVNVSVKS